MNAPRPVMLMARELGPGGTERQLTEMAKALDPSRFEAHVGYFREGPRAYELGKAGVKLLRLEVRSYGSPEAVSGALQLGRYLRRNRIQIVHTFDYPLNCFGVPVARLFRTPVVLSSQRANRRLNPRLYQRLLRATDRMVDAVVVNCDAVRRHLVEDEGVPDARIRLCMNGIDTGRFFPAPRSRPPELEGASLVIGAVCVLRPEKDLGTLVRAFAEVSRMHAGLRLLIVGSGPEGERLAALGRDLEIAERIVFVEATPDVTRWLHATDIFVLPSLSEALSNSLMEAMACGCTPVASDVGGNAELVIPGRTGLLFRPGDAAGLAQNLLTLIEQERLRQELAAAASARILSEFSVQSSARRMEQIYEEFVDRNLRQ
jgi:L-malate glycosyltransferase